MPRKPDVAFVTEDSPRVAPLTVKEPLKKVRVLPSYQVVYDTVRYRGGDIALVPAALADRWIRDQWVTAE